MKMTSKKGFGVVVAILIIVAAIVGYKHYQAQQEEQHFKNDDVMPIYLSFKTKIDISNKQREKSEGMQISTLIEEEQKFINDLKALSEKASALKPADDRSRALQKQLLKSLSATTISCQDVIARLQEQLSFADKEGGKFVNKGEFDKEAFFAALEKDPTYKKRCDNHEFSSACSREERKKLQEMLGVPVDVPVDVPVK